MISCSSLLLYRGRVYMGASFQLILDLGRNFKPTLKFGEPLLHPYNFSLAHS